MSEQELGYAEKKNENLFILTANGWDKAEFIVNDIRKNINL